MPKRNLALFSAILATSLALPLLMSSPALANDELSSEQIRNLLEGNSQQRVLIVEKHKSYLLKNNEPTLKSEREKLIKRNLAARKLKK